MPLRFSVIDSTATPLWDYGWFDRTRFRVEGALESGADERALLAAFLADPLSRRSFCTSDPWGSPGDTHGPLRTDAWSLDWYSSRSLEELDDCVRDAVALAGFPPVSSEQLLPIQRWLDAARESDERAYVLRRNLSDDWKVEWSFVWICFHEFVAVSRARDELTVAVIGYD